MLGSANLPPQKTPVIMAILIISVSVISWKFNIRIYSEAQVADIQISLQSPAANKIIRDFNVRAITGATIIGLEHEEKTLINPPADEILRPGDRIYLLGTRSQLEKARTLLCEQ